MPEAHDCDSIPAEVCLGAVAGLTLPELPSLLAFLLRIFTRQPRSAHHGN